MGKYIIPETRPHYEAPANRVVTVMLIVVICAILAAVAVAVIGEDEKDTIPTNAHGGYNQIMWDYEPDVVFVYNQSGRTLCSFLVSSGKPENEVYKMGCGDSMGEYVDLDD